MRLTAEGRAFRPHAQRALQSLASGRELLRELREGRVGELLVGAAPAISTYVLPLVLRRFQANFPNVHLIVRTGHSEEVLELVLREQVQIGLVRELPHPAVDQLAALRGRDRARRPPRPPLRRRDDDRRARARRRAADPLRPHLELLRPHERLLPRGRRRAARRDGARQRRRDEEDGRARARDRVPPLHRRARGARVGRAARRSRSRATSRCGGRSWRCAGATPSCPRISSKACSRRCRGTSSSARSARRPAEIHHDRARR